MNDYPDAVLIVGEMLASDLVGRSHEVYPIGHHVAVKCRFCDHLTHFNTVEAIELYCTGILLHGCSQCGIHPDRVPDIAEPDTAATCLDTTWDWPDIDREYVTHDERGRLRRRIEGAVLLTVGLGMAAVSAVGWLARRWAR
jgi:hypothetical protein